MDCIDFPGGPLFSFFHLMFIPSMQFFSQNANKEYIQQLPHRPERKKYLVFRLPFLFLPDDTGAECGTYPDG